ncbi:MAG: tetratricopeptide repeat protein [Deltaproteobacteria bacterium]|nr:tetratricopeptide repeat protein [Deltaproteobacteria bacterium]
MQAALCILAVLAGAAPLRGPGHHRPAQLELVRRPSAAKLVDRGVQYYYEGRYQKAIKLLHQALRSEKLDKTRRIGALQYLAFCQVALGELELARQTFTSILDDHPSFRLPAGTAPKIVKLFEEVRSERAEPLPDPAIQHTSPASGQAGAGLALEARVEHMPAGGALKVRYRHNPQSPYSELIMARQADGRYTANLPPSPAGGAEELAYFLVVADRDGNAMAQVGNDAGPLRVPFDRPGPGPDGGKGDGEGDGKGDGQKKKKEASTWWIWALVGGAAAVAVGVGLGVGLTMGGSEPTGKVVFDFVVVE